MKRFTITLMVVVAATFAKADYLYWQISSSDTAGISGFNSARVGAYTTSYEDATYFNLYVGSGGEYVEIGDSVGVSTAGDTGLVYADVGSQYQAAGYSFFIELINWESATKITQVAATVAGDRQTWANLSNKGYTSDSLTPTTPAIAWHGGTFGPAPEPTGAMLMAIGLGLMALKRRSNVKKA